MAVKRLISFSCVVLSGIFLDAYWTWYSYHFADACSESGNGVPASWLLFTIVLLIPASASLIFRSNPVYVLICLAIWLLHTGFQVHLIAEQKQFEGLAGVNCYRDVGAGEVVSLAFAVMFSATLLAITVAFGAAWLVRKLVRSAKTKCADRSLCDVFCIGKFSSGACGRGVLYKHTSAVLSVP